MRRNKRGSFFDVLGIILGSVIFIILIVAFFIAYRTTGDALEEAQETITIESFNESSQLVIDQADKYPAFWDFLIALVIFGFWIAAFISAYLLGSNPIFLVIYIIMSIGGLITGAVLEFAMEDFITNAILTTYTQNFPITLFIVNNFLLFTIFFIVSIAIGLYLKRGQD